MTGLETAFIFGGFVGFFFGLWFGGRSVLYRMHRDDIQGAHDNYKKRKDKYLGRNLK
jgi:hypothetical protein